MWMGEEGKRKKAPVLKVLVYTRNLHELDLIVEKHPRSGRRAGIYMLK